MTLIYTPIYAAILAVLIIILSVRVALTRRKLRIGVGDKGDRQMLQVIRVHGNAIEYIPLSLLLMAFAELNGASFYLLNGCGIALVIGRLLHASGLSKNIGISFGRTYGTSLTWLTILFLAIYLIYKSVAHLMT
ncbi:MAG: MAPEG family protein [Gammaproteobacteria bacterium]|nr:MAPEG family protein [Gammaproteobacteria bacterium]